MRIALLVVLASACSSSYDEQPRSIDAGDGSVTEGGSPSIDAGDAGAEAAGAGGLLPNGGFESSTGTTCAPGWSSVNAVTTIDTNAHGGARACKICNAGDGDDFTIAAVLPFEKGQWILQAQFRAVAGSPAATQARTSISFNLPNGNFGGGKNAFFQLATEWTPVQLDATSTEDGRTSATFSVGGNGPAGSCVLVDDVIVEHF